MTAKERPLPRIGPDSAPFWEAAREGRLSLPWCLECRRPHLPPGPVCPFCLSERLEWRSASGHGVVSSWTRVHKAWFPAFADDIPYVVAQIALDEGPRLTAGFFDYGALGPRVGQKVAVDFERVTPEIALPRFRPAPEVLADSPRAGIGECPAWDAERQRLYWIDIAGRRMYRNDATGRFDGNWALPHGLGSFALRAGGGMVIAWAAGLGLIDPETGVFTDIPSGAAGVGPDFARERFNDGACDRRGRFWAGSLARNLKDPVGHLFRIDPDLSVHRMADGLVLSNGIAWSRDDRTLYHCDSGLQAVFQYPFDLVAGTIGERRVFADFAARRGRPDGCTVDAEGHLWVAEVEGGELLRFAPSGALAGSVTFPVMTPTSLAFGDRDLRTLYVTSLRREGTTEEDAGRLFALRPGVAGVPEPRFEVER
jgi:sugar lactone lactonase YvrE/uncharacterized OB-fold protein